MSFGWGRSVFRVTLPHQRNRRQRIAQQHRRAVRSECGATHHRRHTDLRQGATRNERQSTAADKGRATHIHLKVRQQLAAGSPNKTPDVKFGAAEILAFVDREGLLIFIQPKRDVAVELAVEPPGEPCPIHRILPRAVAILAILVGTEEQPRVRVVPPAMHVVQVQRVQAQVAPRAARAGGARLRAACGGRDLLGFREPDRSGRGDARHTSSTSGTL